MNGKYWDEGITLVQGCTPVSSGCDHCWARAMERRFRRGTGDLPVMFRRERLDRLKKGKPRVISIWNDLFHENVEAEQIRAAWNAFESFSEHVYLVLTKRARRAVLVASGFRCPSNIWLGVTAENQDRYDERAQHLNRWAGKKFLSIEPMLGPIKLNHDWPVDWIVAGAETGIDARPCDWDWAANLCKQAEALRIPFFWKSWGRQLPPQISSTDPHERTLCGRERNDMPFRKEVEND